MRGIDLENSVNNPRQSLRHLDRSEYIRIEEGSKLFRTLLVRIYPKQSCGNKISFNMTYSKQITEVRKLLDP